MDVNTTANRMSAANNESVQVIVRCRPIDGRERRLECSEIVKVYPTRGVIEVENPKSRSENEPNKIFTYDAVYDEESTQSSLYDETVRPLVASVLDGYNGCVFAYGQTGTGKTYTMEGVGLNDATVNHGDIDGVPGDVGKGVIPRAFDQIWAHINRTTGTEFLVTVRYLEIYMENIRDLLRAKSTKPLELREQTGRGVFVSHLHSQTCQSATDMLKAMKIGNHNRTTGATNMNEHSSRSHAIFQIVVEMVHNTQGDTQQQQDQRTAKVGKLNLIDLAGSERQSKSGASGDRLKEASKINKSLSALGNVIYALAESSPHIPYRDSKLTRLLQDSLGGNSKTIMIANVGPASMNYDETIITLRYAYRAKSIKNQPIKNEDCRDAKLLELQDEISRLRALIAAKTSGKLDLSALLDGDQDGGSSSAAIMSDTSSASSSDDEEGGVREGGERLERLQSGKIEVDELGKKLRQLEKQMVHGGKNIVDSVNENEIRLEEQKSEISRRKKREIEMQQHLELEEESCEVIRQKFANVQQEVDYKRDMFKKLHNRLQGLKQEIKDNHANYLKDRQELAEANDEATMQLRQKLLIIDNFIPSEERSRLLGLAHFDEDSDNWQLSKNSHYLRQQRYLPNQRPVARTCHYKRPISEYALTRAIATTGVRYRSENILDLKLDLPLRTTRDYVPPSICPQVKAAVRDIIIQDERNCHVIVKHGGGGGGMAPTVRNASYNQSASGGAVSKAELEGRYKRASRSTVDIHQQQRSGGGNS